VLTLRSSRESLLTTSLNTTVGSSTHRSLLIPAPRPTPDGHLDLPGRTRKWLIGLFCVGRWFWVQRAQLLGGEIQRHPPQTQCGKFRFTVGGPNNSACEVFHNSDALCTSYVKRTQSRLGLHVVRTGSTEQTARNRTGMNRACNM
jgi:hypothetical protein